MSDRSLAAALALLAAALLAGACERAETPAEEPLASEDEKIAYALGHNLGKNLQRFGLSEAESEAAALGLRDAATGGESRVALDVYAPKIQDLGRRRLEQAAAAEREASQAVLEQAAAEPGAQRFESGLVMITLAEGTGASPQATDRVQVHYHGTLRDGTVFDSSRDRGTAATFPLNRVIACWTEALQKMKVGGKARIVCPADIAYGDRGAPPRIPPGAALTFEVELLEIVPQAAAPATP